MSFLLSKTSQLFLFGSLSILLFSMLINTPQNTTYDDSKSLSNSNKKVLGVSNNSQTNYCNDEYPVYGYIDTLGDKIILDPTTSSVTPSACFKSLEDANNNGYYKK